VTCVAISAASHAFRSTACFQLCMVGAAVRTAGATQLWEHPPHHACRRSLAPVEIRAFATPRALRQPTVDGAAAFRGTCGGVDPWLIPARRLPRTACSTPGIIMPRSALPLLADARRLSPTSQHRLEVLFERQVDAERRVQSAELAGRRPVVGPAATATARRESRALRACQRKLARLEADHATLQQHHEAMQGSPALAQDKLAHEQLRVRNLERTLARFKAENERLVHVRDGHLGSSYFTLLLAGWLAALLAQPPPLPLCRCRPPLLFSNDMLPSCCCCCCFSAICWPHASLFRDR
jgi:hypothetical protein